MTSKHFIFFVVSTCSISLLVYPSIFVKEGGMDSWIGSIIASAIFLLTFFFISTIYIKLPNRDFKAVVYDSLGKFLGSIYIFIFGIMIFISLVGSAAISSNAISTNVFVNTPTPFILMFFLGSAFYIITRKQGSLNVFVVISTFFLISAFILLTILLQPYRSLAYLKPVFYTNYARPGFYKSLLLQLGSLSSFSILLPIFKNIESKENSKKYIFIALAIVISVNLFSMIGGMAILGPRRFANIFYPLFVQSQILNYTNIIENGDGFVLFLLTTGYMLKYVIAFASLSFLLPKKMTSNTSILAFITVIIFFLSGYISNSTLLLFTLIKIYQYCAIFVFLLVPILIFCIKFFKRI
ncbi:GerAB/ArcD/ProY family transporter [Inconstantimicrobium mannanitabidum]|uniref:GerAB/ArcD/ProY family transporter n=1 Tax=Inconstantimicrobium mannanitabidum TaxID=1604901 RepID=UPI0021C434C4|nr:GerAB/ArcD/ProY family transporter [Clostridium sp. TW13]